MARTCFPSAPAQRQPDRCGGAVAELPDNLVPTLEDVARVGGVESPGMVGLGPLARHTFTLEAIVVLLLRIAQMGRRRR